MVSCVIARLGVVRRVTTIFLFKTSQRFKSLNCCTSVVFSAGLRVNQLNSLLPVRLCIAVVFTQEILESGAGGCTQAS